MNPEAAARHVHRRVSAGESGEAIVGLQREAGAQPQFEAHTRVTRHLEVALSRGTPQRLEFLRLGDEAGDQIGVEGRGAGEDQALVGLGDLFGCLLYTSPSPRD